MRSKDRVIPNDQMVLPTTWNGLPRDATGDRGASEEALVGTPLADPSRPPRWCDLLAWRDPCAGSK